MAFSYNHILTTAVHKLCAATMIILSSANVSNGAVYSLQHEIDTVVTLNDPVESTDGQSNANPASNSLPQTTNTLKGKDHKVVEVYKLGHKDKEDKDRNEAGIGDIIVVKVEGLKSLLDKAKCVNSNGEKIQGCTTQEIRLFIDGRMISNITPESGAPQPEDGELQYHLERNDTNDEAWADLLGAPSIGKNFYHRPVAISVGLENEYPIPSSVERFNLTRLNEAWFWGCIIGFLLYIFLLYKLATQSSLLRDRGFNLIEPNEADKILLGSFSLGRVQMAFWFSLVIISFLFIWLINGSYEISASVLGLIGIGAGTALSAAIIDNSKLEETNRQYQELIAKSEVLRTEILRYQNEIAVVPPPANLAELRSQINAITAEKLNIESQIAINREYLKPLHSEGFLKDILSDVNGVSFHRFQMFVWTIILGLLFVYTVWSRLAMLDFTPTLLALQGLTAGTYLGFKIPEKQH